MHVGCVEGLKLTVLTARMEINRFERCQSGTEGIWTSFGWGWWRAAEGEGGMVMMPRFLGWVHGSIHTGNRRRSK